MKTIRTLKIGRSSKNDIVVTDVTVSSMHAIIKISDDGNIYIEDSNSTNGTYVNGKKIEGLTQIYENDTISVGKLKIDWRRYVEKPSKTVITHTINDNNLILKKITIGRSPTNDIVVPKSDVSSSHAYIAVNKDQSVIIIDQGSSNGTYVNGERITEKLLRKGDIVLLSNKHILNWEELVVVQNKNNKKNNKIIKISLLATSAVACIIIGIFFMLRPQSWSAEKIYSTYKKSTVLIIGSYYYSVSIADMDLGKWIVYNNKCKAIESTSEANLFSGTGFFVSPDGLLLTNNHVVTPWLYNSQESQLISETMQNYIKSQISDPSTYMPLINDIKIIPQMSFIGIIPNDSHFTGMDDIIKCTVVKTSSDPKIDVAVIQTNSKSLPLGVSKYVDLNNICHNDVIIGERIFSIGFPENFNMGTTDIGIEANNQSGEVTQHRGDIEFGHNVAIRGGASGSPVFNKYGQLIGIMNAGFTHTQGYNMAIHAKYAKEITK